MSGGRRVVMCALFAATACAAARKPASVVVPHDFVGITGTVTDARGTALARVTVVAGAPSAQVDVTDDAGHYALPLPPGCYDVTFDYAETQWVARAVPVLDGRSFTLDRHLPVPLRATPGDGDSHEQPAWPPCR